MVLPRKVHIDIKIDGKIWAHNELSLYSNLEVAQAKSGKKVHIICESYFLREDDAILTISLSEKFHHTENYRVFVRFAFLDFNQY